jgi:hypothetical protein
VFYKVIFNDRVIDVLDRLVYLKYQPKHNMMVLCNESEAQAVLSSEKEDIWHVDGWYNIPVNGYDTVELIEIDEIEYKQLKVLNGKTPEQIIDSFVLSLIESGVL